MRGSKANRVCQFLNTVILRRERHLVCFFAETWEAPDRSATCRFSNNHNCNCALVTVRWVAKPLGVFVVQAEHRNGRLRSLGRRRRRGKESGLGNGGGNADIKGRRKRGRKWRRFLTGSISFYDFGFSSPTHTHILSLSFSRLQSSLSSAAANGKMDSATFPRRVT